VAAVALAPLALIQHQILLLVLVEQELHHHIQVQL
jgi:hypothetical protein